MELIITPGAPLVGEVSLPGDKSISHRAALFAALAHGESRIENWLDAGVTRVMIQALSSLGIAWELRVAEGSPVGVPQLLVAGRGLYNFSPPDAPLDCGHSATTLRFLAGALAASGTPAVLDGSAGLRRRPMDRIVRPLQSMGVDIRASDGGTAPLVLGARPREKKLQAAQLTLPVASAQVKTALLLASLAADGPVTITEPAPSRDHTERLLASMGVDFQVGVGGLTDGPNRLSVVPPETPLRPLNLTIPGDFSSAAFLIVAGLIIPGSRITLSNVGLNPTRRGLLDTLMEMGAGIQMSPGPDQGGEPVGDLTIRHSALSGVAVPAERVVSMIDEFPAFAVAAAMAAGTSVVTQAQELRKKETDRITALCRELGRLGAQIRELPDGFVIEGGSPLVGGEIEAGQDHRIAMALAIAGLVSEKGIRLNGAEIINESYPAFDADLQALGAGIHSVGG